MRYVPSLRQQRLGHLLGGLVVIAILLLPLSPAYSQNAAAAPSQLSPEDVQKLSTVFLQFRDLAQKMQSQIQFPAPRDASRLLPLLPESTLVYLALPNYGEAAHQALGVFQQELQENAELRAWWQQGDMAAEGPKLEQTIDRFYQLSQYLGDEIVVAAAGDGKEDPKFVILSQIRKPGLKDFLRQTLKDMAGKSQPSARVYDVAEFAVARNLPSGQPIILVRPDLVILAENLAALRKFNALQEHRDPDFASTDFGQRLSQSYEGGATIVAGADFQRIFQLASTSIQRDPSFQRTGFSDMKYLVWERKNVAGQAVSQMELSFIGPRRGIASWLSAPGPMGSLDFVSPNAVFALALLLKSPTQMFDDVRELATASNPNAFRSVDQAGQQLGFNLRNDLFGRLTGEIALEIDRFAPPNQQWKLLLKTNDAAGLLATLNKFFLASHMTPGQFEEGGVTYYTLPIPSAQGQMEFAYAIVDDCLIVASSRDAVAEAVQLHGSGESFAKSDRLQAALPPGSSSDHSALLYEDPATMAALTMSRFSPALAASLARPHTDTPPAVMAWSADETSIREISRSSSFDVSGPMIVAAIAIPNLLRARMAANESSAVGSVRTLNTAQVVYASAYSGKGYAHDLASLGPSPEGPAAHSPEHASLIDSTLGDASCTSGAWCTRSGYRFTIVTACKLPRCREYVAIATPVSASSGSRNFCSTSDGVVRFRIGSPLASPITPAECKTWPPLN
jgi:hypothetical protein